MTLLLLLQATSYAAQVTDDSFITTTGRPPPGFEHLLAPQQVLANLYFGDRPLGTTMIRYTPGQVQLLEPLMVAKRIPSALNPEALAEALSQPLDPNHQLICGPARQPGCGLLAPQQVGLIFNEAALRLDLFVHADLLDIETSLPSPFLAESTAGLASIAALNLALSGSSETDDDYTLRLLNTTGYRQGRLVSVLEQDQTSGFSVDQLRGELDRHGRQYAAGMFRTSAFGFGFSGEQELLGLRVTRNLRLRTDVDRGNATPLQIFLPLRAQVDLLRDGQLLSSKFYESGNQVLDTRALPSGAYDITLRIRDSGGTREQTEFFIRTSQLPPLGYDLYYLDAGVLRSTDTTSTLPQYSGTGILRGGISKRLRGDLGLTFAGLATSDQLLLESSLRRVGECHEIEASLFTTSDNDTGFAVRSQMNYGQLSSSLLYREIQSSDESNSSEFDVITEDNRQFNLDISYWRGDLQWGFRGRWRQTVDAPESYNFGPRVFTYLHRGPRYILELEVEATQSESEYLTQARIEFTRRTPSWSHVVSSNVEHHGAREPGTRDDDRITHQARVNWRDQDRFPANIDATLTLADDEASQRAGLDGRYRSNRGELQAEVERSDNKNGSDLTRYSAVGSVNLVGQGRSLSWGGDQLVESAVLVKLSGSAEGQLFQVLVNGVPNGFARVGEQTIIALTPYDEYQVSLKPMEGGFVAYDPSPRSAALYPGNVLPLEWEVDEVTVLIGRLKNPLGEVLANARITGGSSPAATDAGGIFQVELRGSVTALKAVLPTGETCMVRLPPAEPENGLWIAQNLSCP